MYESNRGEKILLAADLDPLVREAVNVLSPDLDFQDLPGEEWRDVAGEVIEFKNEYQVSNNSRIRSFCGGRVKLLKPCVFNTGYLYVKLKVNGKTKIIELHRLVAGAFIPNPDPEHKTQVHHRDDNKQNNCVDNLQWVTPSENIRLACESGAKKVGCDHYKALLTAEQVREIRRDCIPGNNPKNVE